MLVAYNNKKKKKKTNRNVSDKESKYLVACYLIVVRYPIAIITQYLLLKYSQQFRFSSVLSKKNYQ